MSAVAEMPCYLKIIREFCRSVQASAWIVRRSVRRSVGPSVGRSVRRSVGRSVGRSVRRSVGRSVGRSVTYLKTISEQLRTAFRSSSCCLPYCYRQAITCRWKGSREINDFDSFLLEFCLPVVIRRKAGRTRNFAIRMLCIRYVTFASVTCKAAGCCCYLPVLHCVMRPTFKPHRHSCVCPNVGSIVFWQMGLEWNLALSEAQVVGRPLTEDAWVRSQASLCEIFSGKSGTGTGFCPSISLFHRQNHSTMLYTYSHTHHRRVINL
jgi:hypothetical protein